MYPNRLDTDQLATLLAGGDDYIRTKRNVVKGLALTRTLNPDAPEVVVFGKGPRVVRRAKLFLESGLTVPAYIKRTTNSWEYLGQYRAIEIRTDKEALRHFGRTRKPDTVAGALILQRMDTEHVSVVGGGYADARNRREIEEAAVKYCISVLVQRGFSITDCQRENRGYDIVATNGAHSLHVEVKGTDADFPRFFLTRNEARVAGELPTWRLFVVSMARSEPTHAEYTWQQLQDKFQMDVLAWECTLNEA
ncbi:MAG: DUF3883 domain-containing protein [Chloracidobacterium sp.]|nr:DUF3883 domain-containing protein [Chloracidobacterium sp.]